MQVSDSELDEPAIGPVGRFGRFGRTVGQPLTHAVSKMPRVASRLRGAVARAAIRGVGGKCGKRLRIEKGIRVRHGWHAGVDLGEDVYLGRDTTIDCPRGGRLVVGSRVTLTQGVFISAAQGVSIGDDALVGEYCSLRDAGHGMAASGVPMRAQPMEPNPIVVAADVWLGRGVAVVAGARIGAGAVIGANSVVRGDIPDRAVAAGAPARVRRFRDGP